MASRQIQINTLIDVIANAIRSGDSAEAAATATSLRRAVWTTLTPAQQAQVLRAARRRATSSTEKASISVTTQQSGMARLTILLRPTEAQTLDQLATDHGVGIADILTAFAADLAGAYATSLDERYGGRSGGGDERLFARQWFERNRDPGGWGGPSGARPQFMRRFTAAPDQEEGDGK